MKNIKYSLQQCILNIDNINYSYNLDFNNPKKRELSYIIKKNINNIFYLYDIEENNLNLLSAKESLINSGKKTYVVELKIVNKYYNKILYIKPKDIFEYKIKFFSEKNIFSREQFNKLNFKELNLLFSQNYPIYLTLKNFYIDILDIFSYLNIIYLDKIKKINNYEDLYNLNFNANINDFSFLFEKENSEIFNLYQKKIFLINLKKILKNINNLLLNQNIENNIDLNNIHKYIQDINKIEDKKIYYLNIYGISIIKNNFQISNIDKETGNFEVIFENGIGTITNKNRKKIFFPIEIIDNKNISIHDTLENREYFIKIKLYLLNKLKIKIENFINEKGNINE